MILTQMTYPIPYYRKVCLLFLFILSTAFAQQMQYPSLSEISTLPAWAKLMYQENPNVWEVRNAYESWFRSHPFEKSYHTQYYKRWMRKISKYVDVSGYVQWPSPEVLQIQQDQYLSKHIQHKVTTGGSWSVLGPMDVYEGASVLSGHQTNVYSIHQCAGVPTVMFAGTEPGEVYKSTDGGNTWFSVSMNDDMGGGVSAVACHPTNPLIALAGSGSKLLRTTDGGGSWTGIISMWGLNVNEILFMPSDPSIVMAATDKGLYRSTDGGANFVNLFSAPTFDIKPHPTNSEKVYLVRENTGLEIQEFFLSTDKGATWTIRNSGWYSSSHPDRNVGGARIAVTPADTNRIYVYLIGEAKTNDYGFIGVYRSDNAASSWYLPNGPDGGPYTTAHPNLAYGNPGWTYHQGFYNCAIMASPTNADSILIGGLNLWRSNDGGFTFSSVAGYIGGPLNMHVDNQDFRVLNGACWITCDGGIYKSTDFFTTQPSVSMSGIHGSDYWGFGSGWNEDVLVGGLYHNGNLAYYQDYPDGDFLSLGGGEAPTGYVNPGINRKVLCSDIGGAFLPVVIGSPFSYLSFGLDPNESYWSAASSELEFHPHCYNIAYSGKDNVLWKTEDGGVTFTSLYTFGVSTGNRIGQIEIGSNDPDVMYVHQMPASGSSGILWKTTDGGTIWSPVSMPAGNSSRALLSVDPADHRKLWLACPSGGNGTKIYKTTNGGSTWSNITTSMLDNEEAHSMFFVSGTNGGVYYCTDQTVYYRNNTMPNWVVEESGLPLYFNTDIARPFYRDGKVRVASYGKGIWGNGLYESPDAPVARITVDKLSYLLHCVADSFYFEDYSTLNHSGASWSWTFAGGAPSNSTLRNPAVVWNTPGTYLVTLTVTDSSGTFDTDSLEITVNSLSIPAVVSEDFETSYPPYGWTFANEDGGGQWSLSASAGGYSASAHSIMYDNYNINSDGTTDDFRFSVDLSLSASASLSFDVAYARWGAGYSDTLAVLASTDCGTTWTQVWRKGGTTLATSPDNTSLFVPDSSQWRPEVISLNAFLGNTDVILAFRNKGHWGNAVYADNINITGTVGTLPTQPAPTAMFLYPNPVSPGSEVYIAGSGQEDLILEVFDATGKSLFELALTGNASFILPQDLPSGTIFYRLSSASQVRFGSLLVISTHR